MKRVSILMAAVSVVALAACQKPADKAAPSAPPDVASSEASTDASSSARADRAAADSAAPAEATSTPSDGEISGPTSGQRDSVTATPPLPELALAYKVGMVLPADQVLPLMESHQEACERAGPLQCQVLGAQAKTESQDRASAELDLRATPAWMRAFRGRAEADAKDAGGKVRTSGTVGEDLSQPIVDAEAAQKARAAERDRLRVLMERRTRSLDDTLQVEQELTRVQGEMDAAASEMALMKNRVAMQTLTVEYQSTAMAPADGAGAPVAEASRHFVDHMAVVFAMLINIASVLAPFALIGAPVAWFFSRRSRVKRAVPPAV
jgi:hypothetical protein